MRGKHRNRTCGLAALLCALAPGMAWGQEAAPQVDFARHAAAQEAAEGDEGADWQTEVDRLAGACLAIQAEQRGLRESVRSSVAGLNDTLLALMEAARVLAEPRPAPEAAEPLVAQIETLSAEEAQIERWLWGEEKPDRAGVTRASLRDRLTALRQERHNARLLIQAHTLVGAFDREQLRTAMLEQAEAIRVEINTATKPLRDRLAVLDAEAANEGETFEHAMSRFARISDEGPVTVEAVRADGWFQHGLVSFRWSDRRGRLVATARLRLRPSIDRDMPPPLLLDRFAIIAQAPQEATVSVGYFTVEFSVAVEELAGEQQVLDTLVRLIDLEALAQVQPAAKASGQN